MKKIITVTLSFLIIFLLTANLAYTDDAEVIPKGVSRVGIEYRYYIPYSKQFDSDGNTEDIDKDFNANLNSDVFPALGLVESGFGIPAGSATVGSSIVDIEFEYNYFKLYYYYGLGERLTIGFELPYQFRKTNVDARLDVSNATVGKTAIGTGLGAPLAPLAGPFPDTAPLTTADVQNLLGAGLDTNGDGTVDIPGYGFKPIEDWSDDGIGDLEVGFRYQYLKTNDWRLAFTGGVRFPTGEEDDPDNLMDRPMGDGFYALLFRLNNDYIGVKNLLLNFSFRYNLALPDNVTLRIPDDQDQPITRNKEEVDRDTGDEIELRFTGIYQIMKGLSLMGFYQYGYKWEDKIEGNMGFAYEELEKNSDYYEHIYKVGLTYSTIPLYQEKKFSVPLTATVLYRDRFAGKNILKTQYIGIMLSVFF